MKRVLEEGGVNTKGMKAEKFWVRCRSSNTKKKKKVERILVAIERFLYPNSTVN